MSYPAYFLLGIKVEYSLSILLFIIVPIKYPNNITKVDSDELFHLDFDKPIDYSKINTKVTESRKSIGHKSSYSIKKENQELLMEEDDLLGLKRYADELKTYIGVNKNRPEVKTRQNELDSIVEKLWVALEDVPFIEGKNRELILDGEYLDFPKGTTRDKIWHWFDDMYSKGVAYLINDFDITAHRPTESKKVTEDVEEDLDEEFYEKICRAYIDTLNLEWVTTNPENYDSVVHGYFASDDVAEKYDYGAKVTPENFKEVVYEDTDQESPIDTDYSEYETWEDFYEEYVRDEIAYDINDIGVYGLDDRWDFYISEEDLTKLGLWNEDMKSEFLDESKKVTEAEQYYDLYITYDDNSTGYARVSAKGAGDIVSADISRIKRIDIEDGGMNHDLDENKDEDKILTWDEIFKNAEGTTFGQRALKVKDQARAEVEELMQKDGIDVDNLENVEDEIEDYVTKHNIKFASNGCIIK